MTHEEKMNMVCAHCLSEDVVADANASWNYDEQRWEVEDTFDKGASCHECDGETRIEQMTDDQLRKARDAWLPDKDGLAPVPEWFAESVTDQKQRAMDAEIEADLRREIDEGRAEP